jgi:dethiobiotin synthetase
MMRPAHLIAVVGTHTAVGKTWVAHALLRQWRAHGLRVAARKPVQSFDIRDGCTDAEQLASATAEACHTVCPVHRWYPRAMAPPMAADTLACPRIELRQLVAEITWPELVDVAMVETVGGVRSPLAHDGDSVDLVRCLQPDRVLLIADAGLGALNAIRLARECLGTLPNDVFLNRFDSDDLLHRANLDWLAEHDGVAAFTTLAALADHVQARASDRSSASCRTDSRAFA